MPEQQVKPARFQVKQNENGRQWDVVDTVSDKVVEGGFFKKSLAIIACEEWNRDDFR